MGLMAYWQNILPTELMEIMDSLDHMTRQSVEVVFEHLGKELLKHMVRDDVTEIMVNPDGRVWVEDHARGMYALQHVHLTPEARQGVVTTLASLNGMECTPDDPGVSGLFPPFAARFEGAIPPAVKEPFFAMRLPVKKVLTLNAYVAHGNLTPEQAKDIVDTLIIQKRNVLVAGGTGSGKTTFSNALLDLLSHTSDRVVTIEDTQELQNNVPNAVAFQVNRQSRFRYVDALRASLRVRPDRIIVGELRDGESTEELLKAWNTGHGGGIATIHANSSRSSLPRIEQLLRELRDHPDRHFIAEAINLVVYLERYTDADTGHTRRRIREVSHVLPDLDAQGRFQFRTLYHPSVPEHERR